MWYKFGGLSCKFMGQGSQNDCQCTLQGHCSQRATPNIHPEIRKDSQAILKIELLAAGAARWAETSHWLPTGLRCLPSQRLQPRLPAGRPARPDNTVLSASIISMPLVSYQPAPESVRARCQLHQVIWQRCCQRTDQGGGKFKGAGHQPGLGPENSHTDYINVCNIYYLCMLCRIAPNYHRKKRIKPVR
jgi:hypothetical protein